MSGKASVAKGKELAADVPFLNEELFALSMKSLQDFMQSGERQQQRHRLSLLQENPPQVLLVEGGDTQLRYIAGLYWSLLLVCASSEKPCLSCHVCRHFIARIHRDFFLFDGSSESIKIQDVRDALSFLGEAPREAHFRIFFFYEAHNMVEATANSLLKSLEEPHEGALFILSSPQRERLLPTIISRSTVLTLSWPKSAKVLEEQGQILDFLLPTLCRFLQSGSGLFSVSSKNTLNLEVVGAFLVYLRCCINIAVCGTSLSTCTSEKELVSLLQKLEKKHIRILDELIASAQESLLCNVSPVLVFEWLVTKMYILLRVVRKNI